MWLQRMKSWADREKPIKCTKKKYEKEDNNTRWKKAKLVKDYDYYICDFCNKEIKIEKKWEERSGGIVNIPFRVKNKDKVTVALHNKCLKPLLQKIKEEEHENNICTRNK